MPERVRLCADAPPLRTGLDAVREQHDVPGAFPPEVDAEVREVLAAGPQGDREDRRDLELLTIDPAGSMDLDQALHLAERPGGGHRVSYAIADVAAWVAPGGAIDAEARRRVVTRYLPDGRAPLHPPALSEGAASLLPGEDRPAVLWEIDLGADGEVEAAAAGRALVRSRRRLSYEEVAGDPVAPLLRAVGEARIARERARGGIDLPVPEQEVEREPDGTLRLALRATLPAERHNAQLSLLTGICAAQAMAARGAGLVRTLPPPEAGALAKLERVGRALGIPWHGSAGEALRHVDVGTPAGAAFAEAARALLRGSGYAVVDGPDPPVHAAVGAPYAHVTAPLRRLADRFAIECALGDPPAWVREALPSLPEAMAAGTRAAGAAERAAVDLVEALVLEGRAGEAFDAVVLGEGDVLLVEPVVRARCAGDPPVGERVSVRLAEADPPRRRVAFAWPG